MQRLSGFLNSRVCLFFALWTLLFLLYLPAANAGFTGDFTGWLDNIQKNSFLDFVNRKHFGEKSLYQATQFSTYVFYKLLGANPWPWHILFVTLQAINALLVLLVSKRLFEDTGVTNAPLIAFCGAILFCVSPYVTEIVVWEPAFHYLEAFLFIILILFWLLKYLHNPKAKYAWWAAVLFFVSTHSLEIFYLTPCLVLLFILYYRRALHWDRQVCNKAFYYFLIPLLSLFVFYFIELRLVFGTWIAHIDSGARNEPLINGLGKPAKYLLRIIFLERTFPSNIRGAIYNFCDSYSGITIFYGGVLLLFSLIAFKIPGMKPKIKAMSLMFICTIGTLLLMIPLWFEPLFLTFQDRHAYLSFPFCYLLLALLFFSVPGRYWGISLFAVYAFVNARYTIKVNRYWMKSAWVISRLLHTFPDPGRKVALLLDLPENMQGVPMITASDEGEFKLMTKLFLKDRLDTNSEIYDVVSFNTLTPADGVHITVLSDSSLRVTANQWGTWWFYNGLGATSYENKYYRVIVNDAHFYDLIVKQNPEKYLFLYQTAGAWKEVDWSKKNTDQY